MIAVKLDPRTLKMRPDSGKVYFTYSDLVKLPEYPESPLIELIGGELFVVPSPTVNHQRISQRLEQIISQHVNKNQLGELLHAPIDVLFSEEDAVIPDIIFIEKAQSSIIHEKNIQGTPTLIIEILSENKKRDFVKKKRIYEKYGVTEYWIIDPNQHTIIAFDFDQGDKVFVKRGLFSSQDEIQVNCIPALKFQVGSIF